MSLLLASAALTAAAMVPACSWNTPGRHPYRGTPVEAVSRYTDIPAATRAVLAARIAAGAADDRVIITRDTITGRQAYAPDITDMHFGRQTVCERVTRERWQRVERFKFYSRHAWQDSGRLRWPLRAAARWRCTYDWYALPIEKTIADLVRRPQRVS